MATPLSWCVPVAAAPGACGHGREKDHSESMAALADGSTLPGRVARYVRVATIMGRFVSHLAGERYLGRRHDRAALARELKEALGRLRGPIVKAAQMLATVPGALPAEYVAEMLALQSNAPPMGWTFVKRRMASELGPDWPSRFAAFEREAAAAASLGQVHRATGLDGRLLACKLQYPGMETAVEADLRGLDVALRVLQQYQRALIMGNVRAELEERLREELDYALEARHMALYRDMLRGEPRIHVPEPVPELSTKRLLTMTWLEGQPLLSWLDRAGARQRADLAETMFRAWYVPFFNYGVLHGDPHLGNYTVRPDGSLNLLDFGCVRTFPPALVRAVIDLYHAVRTGDEGLAAHAYRTWRFKNLSREVMDALNVWARFIFEPGLEDTSRTLGALTGDVHGREIAERVIAELHRAGGVDVPREFVIMDRAAIGLGAVFLHLQAEVNWHRLFNDLIADFDFGALERRQALTLCRHGVPRPA
ncbi:MAG TPA: AarF/UbiB family protein [Geminicoccaceae bacterium]|nr:AarF/UbiB family protein [Geminicoccaceae bacterium]